MLLKILRSGLLVLVFASACLPRNLPKVTPRKPGTPQPTVTARPSRTPQPTATTRPTRTPTLTPTPVELAFPIRAAFYEPGYPQAWKQGGQNPFTRYHPGLGFYTLDDPGVIGRHIAAMQYGRIQVGIAAWPGPGQGSDARVPLLLEAGAKKGFYWALEALSESEGNPGVDDIRADLAYIRVRYSGSPGYLRLGGRFVVFVRAGADDGCEMVQRWQQAGSMGAYLVLQDFQGSADCAAQPDGWYPALAGDAAQAQAPSSFAIRPGLWRGGEDQPELARDLLSWMAAVRAMAVSGSHFQLIETFNDWGEGSAVEDAGEWSSGTGFGIYLDALHFNGNLGLMFPHQVRLPFMQNDPGVELVGAGDIANCRDGSAETARLLDRFPNAAIFTAGDNAQDVGSEHEFRDCFDPTWGRFKDRIHPSPGNHDSYTDQMIPYFDYFGAAAGDRDKGYYSYDLGAWHIVSLDSNCVFGGCEEGSPQEQWLKADLAAHPSKCTLAYWHHPFFNSGRNGEYPYLTAFWRDLYNAGAEIIINGHDHDYERFAPMDPNGNLDPERGIREFVVGTGGVGFLHIHWERSPNSEVLLENTLGIIDLHLYSDRYEWEYVPAEGFAGADSGSGTCH